MSRSLRGRLARTLGITAALSVAATALITFGLVRHLAQSNVLRDLERRADAIAGEASGFEAAQVRTLRRLLQTSGDNFAIVGPRGLVQTEDPAAREVAGRIDLQRVLAGEPLRGVLTTSFGDYAYVALPAGGTRARPGALILARPVGLAGDVWRPVLARVLLAGGLAVAIAVGASALVANRLLRPVRRMGEATARVAAGDLAHRVPVEGDGEVADLARRFNAMAEGLAEARRREHEFLASVSHELRTPITAIRGYAEAIGDGAVAGDGLVQALSVIRDEADRLERLVQDVMDLARLGAREFRLDVAEVDLAQTLQEAVRAHASEAAEAGLELAADIPDGLVAATDPGRVRQIVTNLVENALQVTPRGGTVRVGGAHLSGEVVVEVSDTGPGISAQDLPHVFERSYLWTVSRGTRRVGTGLGLAIVRELATALGGRLEVESRPESGSTFRLRLPPRAALPSLG